ncbi:hypothetical protein L484_022801 [Morus notabilis]|uniref:Uncharacterized protein n=1 Tax=Morus notabilis TaxID=981085 RepID=W9S573_9ROSA|nr:hypothetical protein L484_022801 [Morus notabilis]
MVKNPDSPAVENPIVLDNLRLRQGECAFALFGKSGERGFLAAGEAVEGGPVVGGGDGGTTVVGVPVAVVAEHQILGGTKKPHFFPDTDSQQPRLLHQFSSSASVFFFREVGGVSYGERERDIPVERDG